MNTLVLALVAALPALPATPKKPVVDVYHGTKVTDDYRWLEKDDDPAVQEWTQAQSARARAYLDELPGRQELTRRLTELMGFESPSWGHALSRGGMLFTGKSQPPRPLVMLVVVSNPDDVKSERVLVDPVALDPTGATAMDFFEPSLDGKHVAVSLSSHGTEMGDAHVFDVATGKRLEVVPGVNSGTAGGSLAWVQGGFFYTRHPQPGERPAEDLGFYQQVYFHKLGTDPKSDTYALGKDFLRIAESDLSSSEDGKWVADLVQKGDGGEYELYLRSPQGTWTKVAEYADKVVRVRFGADALYLISKKGAPRAQLLKLPLATPTLDKATVLVPEGEHALLDVVPTSSRLYLREQRGGPSGVRAVDLAGKPLPPPPTPEVSTVSEVVRWKGDDVLLNVGGYLEPASWYRYGAADGKLAPTALKQRAATDLSAFEVVKDTCTSKDGTKVPLNIVRGRGVKLDGNNPTLLTAYGGFGISLSPTYRRHLAAFLERGGVWAEANIRGGGEFGEAWHEQGALANKQHCFDDFLACAQRLVDTKVTQPKRLAIEGASNGGLLMGAALTQAPRQFAAVVAHVGYFDMLRYETAPNGVFNTTEYGSVKDPAHFKALFAYSPFHRVKKGTQYPSVLLLTGSNDPRVAPFHSRKMLAKLVDSGTKRPALLRTSDGTGHGLGTPLAVRVAQAVDVNAFIFEALGVKLEGK